MIAVCGPASPANILEGWYVDFNIFWARFAEAAAGHQGRSKWGGGGNRGPDFRYTPPQMR